MRLLTFLGLLIAGLGSWSLCDAASPICLRLDWDYAATPRLGSFFVYVSETSGVYPIVKDKPLESLPRVIVEAPHPKMPTEVSCAALKLTGAGPWYSVVTAVSVDMLEESPPSNEVKIPVQGAKAPLPDPPNVPPPPPIPPVVDLPPPLPWPPRPVGVPPWLPAGPGPRLTETDVWRGIGVTPTPPVLPKVPGAPERSRGRDRLTETPTWQGR